MRDKLKVNWILGRRVYNDIDLFLGGPFWRKIMNPTPLACQSIKGDGHIPTLVIMLHCFRLGACEGFSQARAPDLTRVLGGLMDVHRIGTHIGSKGKCLQVYFYEWLV